ncbi:hypothetical protein EW145_g7959, partial [Phellinidium pouzarii]
MSDWELDLHHSYCDSDADITLESSDGVRFRVHSLILRLSSEVFAGMIAIPRVPSHESTKGDIVHLTEKSDITLALLDSIYPRRSPPQLEPFSFVLRLATAADKYDIFDVTSRIRGLFVPRGSLPNLSWGK